MKVWAGPTGKLIHGHVLDVSQSAFTRALRAYDSLLYVRWQPKKLNGYGCWQVRRRPAQKEVVERIPYKGITFSRVEYREIDFVNHVMDSAFLNYDIITKLKQMDTWENGTANNYAKLLEDKEAKRMEEEKAKNRKESLYIGKQHKKIIKDFKEMLLSGLNPAEIARYWK